MVNKGGRQYRIGFDEYGKIVSETPTGGTSSTSNDGPDSMNNLPAGQQATIKELQNQIDKGDMKWEEAVKRLPALAPYLNYPKLNLY